MTARTQSALLTKSARRRRPRRAAGMNATRRRAMNTSVRAMDSQGRASEEMCGVTTRLIAGSARQSRKGDRPGAPRSALSTSSAAPASRPPRRALATAASSNTSPRDVLTSTAWAEHAGRGGPPIRPCVEVSSGTCTLMTSASFNREARSARRSTPGIDSPASGSQAATCMPNARPYPATCRPTLPKPTRRSRRPDKLAAAKRVPVPLAGAHRRVPRRRSGRHQREQQRPRVLGGGANRAEKLGPLTATQAQRTSTCCARARSRSM